MGRCGVMTVVTSCRVVEWTIILFVLVWHPYPVTALMNYQRVGGGGGIISNGGKNSASAAMWTMRLNPTSFEGSDMTIAEYPKPVLRKQPNKLIEEFDDKLRETAREMMSIMYQANGVGLAAPQVHLDKQLFVYNPTGDRRETKFERVVCNPIIKDYSKEWDIEEEGCLSSLSDDCAGCVCRACAVMVEYRNELGQKTMRRLSGFEARVFQHEYDHIQGILHFDRFSKEDREKNQAILDKLVEQYDKDDAILDPDPGSFEKIQPPPLSAGMMPPKKKEPKESKVATKKKAAAAKAMSGFGGGSGGAGGGFGGGGSKKPKGKKKKKG